MGDLDAMDPSAVGRQVAALEEAGLVARCRHEADGRVTIARITPRGSDVLDRLVSVGDRHLADAFQGWSQRDREDFARLLARFVDDVQRVRVRTGSPASSSARSSVAAARRSASLPPRRRASGARRSERATLQKTEW